MTQNTFCPDDETLTDYIEGRLTEARIVEVERHLAACPVCRELAMVSAELVHGDPAWAEAPVPGQVTQQSLARLAGLKQKRRPSHIFDQSRQWVAKKLAAIEAFSWGSLGSPMAVRGGAVGSAGTVVKREKQFDGIGFAIELRQTGEGTATIEVAWAAGQPQGKVVRVALMAQERELASSVLNTEPILFEEIAFGAYTLLFVSAGKRVGEYAFEIQATQAP